MNKPRILIPENLIQDKTLKTSDYLAYILTKIEYNNGFGILAMRLSRPDLDEEITNSLRRLVEKGYLEDHYAK